MKLSVYDSSCSHIWDAFQLAYASYRLYCEQSLNVSTLKIEKASDKLGPDLLGEPPKIDIAMPEVDVQEDEDSPETLPEIQIYDDDVNIRFLVCGVPSKLVDRYVNCCAFVTFSFMKMDLLFLFVCRIMGLWEL